MGEALEHGVARGMVGGLSAVHGRAARAGRRAARVYRCAARRPARPRRRRRGRAAGRVSQSWGAPAPFSRLSNC